MKENGHFIEREDGLAWLELVREPVFVTDAKQNVLAANAAGARLVGRDWKDLRKLGWRDLLSESDQARWDALTARETVPASLGGRWELRHQDGRGLAVEIETAEVGRKRTALVARPAGVEESARFRFIVDRVPQFIWTAGPDGTVQFCNGFWNTFTGLSEAAWAGSRWKAVVHPEDLPAVEAGLRAALAAGETLDTRLRLRRADGAYRWFRVRWEPVRNEAGRPESWVGVGMDIEEQVRLEEALRKSEELFHELARLSPVGIFRTDPLGRCIYVNERWREMTGLSWETARGDGWSQALPAEERSQVLTGWRSAILAGLPYHSEFQVQRLSGESSWVLCQAVPEKDARGETLGYIGTLTDITEGKRAEEHQLLMERRLQEAQKLESLAVLAGGVAHDFNNLLTGILGNASLARSEMSATDDVQLYLQQIEQASLRAAELCKQMLAYSGKGRFIVENLSVNALLEDVVKVLQPSWPQRVALHRNLAPKLPPVRGDAGQIRQVLINLLMNGMEALGEKGGLVSVSTGVLYASRTYFVQTVFTPDLPEGDYVFVEISDNGCGMAPDTLKKIFDPFFSTKFVGRGLGLAAVLGIVRGHKGAIHVYSEPGRGSAFKILLPGVQTRLEEPLAPPPELLWRGRGTVLVVDDEELIRTVAGMMLKTFGFEPLVAAGGREALDLYREKGRDVKLVLLDLSMPGMDGVQTFHELRALQPDLPVLLMSGFNEVEAVNRFAGRGLAGFLQKPFRPETLRSKLQIILG